MPEIMLQGFAFSELWQKISAAFGKYVLEALKEITIIDIADILLLTVIFYYVFIFISKRRAGRLVMGILIIFAVLIVCSFFRLKAVMYIIQTFYQVGMIALLIIFQSDIRAALESFGNTPVNSLKKMTNSAADEKLVTEYADCISEAVGAMSDSKTGALIVIERSTKLGEYLKHGTKLDAELSPMLLRNIFYDKAPLHDGAVIISNGKIYAAGCYMPLSSNEMNKDLGTRHRAALGISEQSDAIVVVVSEETGVISVACGGELSRYLSAQRLRSYIIDNMAPQSKQKNSGLLAKFRKKEKNNGGKQ